MKSRLALASVLLVAAGLAACGKPSTPPASSGDPTTTTTEAEAEDGGSPTETTVEEEEGEDGQAGGGGEAAELAFTGTEYAYAAVGGAGAAPIPAGEVTVTLTNEGVEEHQISIARLREGKTLDDFVAVGEDPSQLATVIETFGGPNAVAPGATGSSTQTLEAGEYLFVCFIPAPDGEPHAAKGMLLPVTVEGEAEVAAPEGIDPIAMGDFTFGLGTPEEPVELSAAEDWVLTNDGSQPHEAAIYTVADGATNEDVVAYFSNPSPTGPPPIVPAGGVGPIDPGRFVTTAIPAGDYVFICFIPDAADGVPHFAKGMLQFATVS